MVISFLCGINCEGFRCDDGLPEGRVEDTIVIDRRFESVLEGIDDVADVGALMAGDGPRLDGYGG